MKYTLITVFLFVFPILGSLSEVSVDRIDSQKKCLEISQNKNGTIDYRQYGGSCSVVCLTDGYGNKSTSFQQPNGALCHEDLPSAKDKNWMCYKGQCVTKDAVNVCVKMLGSEENVASVVYQLCTVFCVGKGEALSAYSFNSSQSCFKQGKLGNCSMTKTCVV